MVGGGVVSAMHITNHNKQDNKMGKKWSFYSFCANSPKPTFCGQDQTAISVCPFLNNCEWPLVLYGFEFRIVLLLDCLLCKARETYLTHRWKEKRSSTVQSEHNRLNQNANSTFCANNLYSTHTFSLTYNFIIKNGKNNIIKTTVFIYFL